MNNYALTQETEKLIRRDHTMIVLDILRVLSEKERRFTQILYKSNLSCDRLKRYLAELMNAGLVVLSITPKLKTMYRLTDEGLNMYNQYATFNDLLKGMRT